MAKLDRAETKKTLGAEILDLLGIKVDHYVGVNLVCRYDTAPMVLVTHIMTDKESGASLQVIDEYELKRKKPDNRSRVQ